MVLVAAGVACGQTGYPYVITTLAGSNPLGDGGQATSALLEFPQAVAVDASGNVYIADGNVPAEIRKVTKDGAINVLVSGYSAYALATDAAGDVYFATYDAVYKVSPAGNVTKFAGGTSGYGGDEGPATAASLNNPDGLTLDAAGNLYIADTYNCRIREVTTDGNIHTIAGTSNCGSAGNYGPATTAQLNYPVSVAVDSAGCIYVGEHNYIRKIARGNIAPFAGGGNVVSDGTLSTQAIPHNTWLFLDRSGNLYFTDGDNSRVRKWCCNDGCRDARQLRVQRRSRQGNLTAVKPRRRSSGTHTDWRSTARGIYSFPMDPATVCTKWLPMGPSAGLRGRERMGTAATVRWPLRPK